VVTPPGKNGDIRKLWIEKMTPSSRFWLGKSVFVTGHTGFKGSWLSLWLTMMGAKVHGYALNPVSRPNLFDVLNLQTKVSSDIRANINEFRQLTQSIEIAAPEIVFHLAAQPLVRQGYLDPIDTFFTNIMGTVHLLQAVRNKPNIKAIVVITTDKVYECSEEINRFNETDRLGAHDPYSASKVAAEIISASYKYSFFNAGPKISTARAGNVIGGGDWSADRLVPDCIKAFLSNNPVLLRFPSAIRPWQHVLEPISGYLILAEKLFNPRGAVVSDAYNFGPEKESEIDVNSVAQKLAKLWGNKAKDLQLSEQNHPAESKTLRLNADKAKADLGWVPTWNLDTTLEKTTAWYRNWSNGEDMFDYSCSQINEYKKQSSLRDCHG